MTKSPTKNDLLRTMLFALSLGALTGCDARFFDLREASPDLAASLGSAPNASTDGGGIEAILAKGRFLGRVGHVAAGEVHLARLGNGDIELRFLIGFGVTDVPGPVVVLTSRTEIGTTLDPGAGDITLSTLRAPAGAQTYLVPRDDPARRNVFIFCKPLGVEVALAALVNQP